MLIEEILNKKQARRGLDIAQEKKSISEVLMFGRKCMYLLMNVFYLV